MALAQEFRLAARTLARNKGWTAAAVLAFALGLGANVAIFSVVGLMLWTPLPYPHPEQLAYLPQTHGQRGFRQAAVSLRDVRDWARAEGIASIAAYQSRPVAISGQAESQHLPAMQVTPEFFPTLGVAPVLGRGFLASETPETESRVAILSHELWQGTYQGDAGVLGRRIRLDGRDHVIVGVMPAGFHFLFQRRDVWTPLSLTAGQRVRDWRGLSTLARLRPGVTPVTAAAQVRAISEQAEREEPASGRGWRGTVRPLTDRVINRGARASAFTMFGAVGLVLLIACANVASLVLARGTQRARELALRASLGAGRGSLMRLQLAESLLLSLVGGAVGVLSAIWSIPLLKRLAPPEMGIFELAALDWTALAFGLGISVVSGVVAGILPAWLLTGGDLAGRLQEAGRGSTGGRHLALKSLVVAEMALALVLTVSGTLLIRSLIHQAAFDPGFDKTNLSAGHVLLSSARYPAKTQVVDFFSRALTGLRREGGVESAALVSTIPLGGDSTYSRIRLENEPDSSRESSAGDMVVSPGYFQTLRIPLVAGREFTEADNESGARVAIVNQAFVRRYWPTAEPIGRHVRMNAKDAPWMTVVGVARDVRHSNLTDPPRPELYRPHAQSGERIMMLVARGRNTAPAVRRAVAEVDREQPVFRLQTVEAMIYSRNSGPRATTQVLGGMAVIALILAALGTYGVMAYTAARRVREIGIRLALGATGADVFRMVLRSGLALAGVGLAIGLPAAYATAPVLRAVADGLDAADGASYAGVGVLLLTMALVACAVPAWKAMRVDPARVLRDE